MKFIYQLFLFLSLACMTNISSAQDLPPEAQRDLLVLKLAEHLKNEQWKKAYPIFEKIDAINEANALEVDHSITYYRGEVAYHLKKYPESYQYLTDYINKEGSKGGFYLQSLRIMSGIEDVDIYQLAYDHHHKDDRGIPANMGKAIELYELSARMGNAKAHFMLADLYSRSLEEVYGTVSQAYEDEDKSIFKNDRDKGIFWYREVAEHPDKFSAEDVLKAQVELGTLYWDLRRRGIKPDEYGPKAIKLFTIAADERSINGGVQSPQKHPYYVITARSYLGFAYENGAAVKKDVPRAIALYKSIKDSDPVSIAATLGEIYYKGAAGVPVDYQEAEYWLRRALKKGNEVNVWVDPEDITESKKILTQMGLDP